MTKEEFHKLWTLTYPDAVPISYLFKHKYSDSWFRIHSLPESKRYADSDSEWKILLTRQNEIITDLFGFDEPVFLITSVYDSNYEKPSSLIDAEKDYSFTHFDNIDLYELDSEVWGEGTIYQAAFAETIWNPHQHDKLLREIANDESRAFFVSFDKNVIVAPYDGGVDFVLKDSLRRDFYKNKYRQWLSWREDGL